MNFLLDPNVEPLRNELDSYLSENYPFQTPQDFEKDWAAHWAYRLSLVNKDDPNIELYRLALCESFLIMYRITTNYSIDCQDIIEEIFTRLGIQYEAVSVRTEKGKDRKSKR